MHNDSKEGKYQVIPIVCVDDRIRHGVQQTVFCERVDPRKYQDRIEKALVYFWNRKYPS